MEAAALAGRRRSRPLADRAPTAYGTLPLTFVEARGRYVSQGAGHAFAMTREGVGLSLAKPSGEGVNLALRFLGAAGVAPAGDVRAPGTVNYLQGTDRSRWRTNVPTYEGVAYRGLWPGIDMALRGNGGELKYEFRVRAGARVSDIRLIDDSNSFSAPQTPNQTVSGTSFALSTLPTRRMWWRVRANDSSGAPGAWSSARRFEVKT